MFSIERSRRTLVHSQSPRFILRRFVRGQYRRGQQRRTRVGMRGKRVRWSFLSCGRVWKSAKAGSVAPLGSGVVRSTTSREDQGQTGESRGCHTVCDTRNYCALEYNLILHLRDAEPFRDSSNSFVHEFQTLPWRTPSESTAPVT